MACLMIPAAVHIGVTAAWTRSRFDETRLAAVVGNRVTYVEEPTEASLTPPSCIEDAYLARIGIHADVRPIHLADHERLRRLRAAVFKPMGTALAARERDDFALGKIFPPFRRPQRERATKDDPQLLALDVVVQHRDV